MGRLRVLERSTLTGSSAAYSLPLALMTAFPQ